MSFKIFVIFNKLAIFEDVSYIAYYLSSHLFFKVVPVCLAILNGKVLTMEFNHTNIVLIQERKKRRDQQRRWSLEH